MQTLIHFFATDVVPASNTYGLDPGDAGWGDVIFVTIWAIGSLLLAGYYCYKAFWAR